MGSWVSYLKCLKGKKDTGALPQRTNFPLLSGASAYRRQNNLCLLTVLVYNKRTENLKSQIGCDGAKFCFDSLQETYNLNIHATKKIFRSTFTQWLRRVCFSPHLRDRWAIARNFPSRTQVPCAVTKPFMRTAFHPTKCGNGYANINNSRGKATPSWTNKWQPSQKQRVSFPRLRIGCRAFLEGSDLRRNPPPRLQPISDWNLEFRIRSRSPTTRISKSPRTPVRTTLPTRAILLTHSKDRTDLGNCGYSLWEQRCWPVNRIKYGWRAEWVGWHLTG